MAKIFVRADVPDELMKAWLQHVRDFDTRNAGCHFEICMDGPDIPMTEMVKLLQVNPGLKFVDFFERGGKTGSMINGPSKGKA